MARMLEAMRGYRDDELAVVRRFLAQTAAVVAEDDSTRPGDGRRLPHPAPGTDGT
jgi:hypothetical protein